jgi:NAD(P)-dependent dehydrogenase (short-subunit alcohol dehydrogenase family)
MKDLNGKVAVVTGAAQGIGRAFAGKAHSLGMRVVLST